ncbi:MAG: ATP synthase F0 subunit C [Gemmataceae bacterium]
MKFVKFLGLALVTLFLCAAPALAQTGGEKAAEKGVSQTEVLTGSGIGLGIGLGAIIIGAGYGFGKIGSAAFESMSRQPETAGTINGGMIIVAALLEGATLFAILVVLLTVGIGQAS